MPNRLDRILRVVCLGLAALLAWQLVAMTLHRDPLARLTVPAVPRWHPDEDTSLATNRVAKHISLAVTNGSATNRVGLNLAGTNLATGTNLAGTNFTTTPIVAASVVGTNSMDTNFARTRGVETNLVGTNAGGSQPTSTNLSGNKNAPNNPGRAMPGGGAPPIRGTSPALPTRPLSPLIQARIDRITQSELFAPIFRPLPMALLGIAGRDAFIRTPNGQFALLREGGETNGVKLLRLGTNRVLIEHAGEKKEFTIFSGFGSESLLPK